MIREMNLYSNIFCVARDESKLIEKSPLSGVRRPKEPKPRDRRISDDESEKLLFALGYGGNDFATISARVGAMFLFAIETGARASEMVRLTWDRVTLSRQYVHFPKTKNGFARDVALSPRAIKIIQSFAPLRDKENKADPVFKVNTSQLDALFRKARDKCKIKDLHFHDTRHEAITRLAKKLAVLDLARMVGIRDLDILMVYYNETAEDMAKKLAN
ncbi:site-specific integrase [Paraburkholderia panacisoli]|uniref:site-specific integrase n=1 Tax=Paraburkholderia panacisoli TaxID=2603818 RepID=UPI00165F289E|nr:site-specific integrase [Paraburkholderia panacisoli]